MSLMAAGVFTGCSGYESSSVKDGFASGIVGGQIVKSKDSEYLKIVKELINLETTEICTSVLYQKNVFLTAAHCVPKKISNVLLIDEAPHKILTVKDIIVHPSYLENPQQGLDLAMIVVENFEFTSEEILFRASGVFTDSRHKNKDKDFLLLGYGKTFSEDVRDPLLRILKIKFKNDLFKEELGLLRFSQKNKQGICFGDSGGPLFFRNNGELSLVGIAKEVRQKAGHNAEECWGEGVWTDLRPLGTELQRMLPIF